MGASDRSSKSWLMLLHASVDALTLSFVAALRCSMGIAIPSPEAVYASQFLAVSLNCLYRTDGGRLAASGVNVATEVNEC